MKERVLLWTRGTRIQSERGGTFYIYTKPKLRVKELDDILEQAISHLETWMLVPYDGHDMPSWWIYYRPCKYCMKRYVERKDMITPENLWKEGYCLRHGAIYALKRRVFDTLDNKPRWLSMVFEDTLKRLEYFTCSNKHFIRLTAIPKMAMLRFDRWGFTYRQHTNAFPDASTYDFLIATLKSILHEYQLMVTDPEYYYQNYGCIIVLNGEVLTPQ